jgi:hypothetical protein
MESQFGGGGGGVNKINLLLARASYSTRVQGDNQGHEVIGTRNHGTKRKKKVHYFSP